MTLTKCGELWLVWDCSDLFHLEKPPYTYKDKEFCTNSPGSIHTYLPLRLIVGESLHIKAKLNQDF